ncbi:MULTISPECIES: DUF1501 domain-containing protein [unclassified Sphingomonas]|uniref:DUF1501 domain-containing protein n=1 Tax=unclassified Sphingomonas TaxID=196159 RepID=UPI00285597BE|nr:MULTISPECIES: DUF1501 domain-containing protein [unclassified Sphingomonas]MDR6114630.1 uncharacterized protein (DUF1501 family) [Sphingomonas sp. SORGH_AS_0789]MDR6151697.1 uncharacterized protein (DUF1501 family) [Sphingomonas sp. SORGH_AS_0742]
MTIPPLHRRDLLKGAAAMAPMVVAGRAFAAPQAGSRLLVVFLRGAYDAVNIVSPSGSDFYRQSRPTIALARPDPADPHAPLPLDADWALHPALKDTILPLWQTRQIAFVPFAGTDDMSRSHFETQDTIELGQPVGGHRDYGSGFMARLADILGTSERPIAFTDQLPLCFRGGEDPIPNLALANVGKPIDQRQAALIQSMYAGHPELARSVSEGFAVRDTVYRTLDQEMKAASRGAVSPKGFALSAQRIGTLMRDRFNLAFVDVGGWDTHVNQGGATGYLADRIGELGRGLAGFVQAIGPEAWRTTTVVVVSEFGRTFRENGDRGTDHGHGSIYWVLGGGVSGGRMAGDQVALSAATLNQNRDLPVLTDYRALIGGLVGRQFGLSGERLATLFPGSRASDLKLV